MRSAAVEHVRGAGYPQSRLTPVIGRMMGPGADHELSDRVQLDIW